MLDVRLLPPVVPQNCATAESTPVQSLSLADERMDEVLLDPQAVDAAYQGRHMTSATARRDDDCRPLWT